MSILNGLLSQGGGLSASAGPGPAGSVVKTCHLERVRGYTSQVSSSKEVRVLG